MGLHAAGGIRHGLRHCLRHRGSSTAAIGMVVDEVSTVSANHLPMLHGLRRVRRDVGRPNLHRGEGLNGHVPSRSRTGDGRASRTK